MLKGWKGDKDRQGEHEYLSGEMCEMAVKDFTDADMIYLLPTIVSSRSFPVHPRHNSI